VPFPTRTAGWPDQRGPHSKSSLSEGTYLGKIMAFSSEKLFLLFLDDFNSFYFFGLLKLNFKWWLKARSKPIDC
jgi:hypothetical protein